LVQQEKDSVKFIRTGNAFVNYPKGNFHKIRHMALDEAGNIWIGTTSGLLILDPNDQHSSVYKYISYSKIPGVKESLGNNDVQFIHRDLKNRMWLATSGGGFCQAIGNKPFRSLRFRNYTTKDGLPNDYVLSCAEDKQGNLWIATENGLSEFKPESGVFKNYDSYEGLPRAGFSEAAACRPLTNGTLVFGTTKGYLYFNPESISNNRIAANIVFTNLQINNEDAGPGANETVLKIDINYISELTLKYNQNIISIDYALLDHRAGNRQAFAYRLVGFDTMWHDDQQQRRATYTNLPPGHYVFEVKSLSADLYTNTPFRRLGITILPPPWKTWWAYLLYTVFIGVMLFFIRRYALAMIRLRNKIVVEQKLAALKLNFFTNVSHELRTPLTLIVNPLEQLALKEKLSPEGASYVDVARKNANRMVRFINQLLDLRKVQSDKATLQISRVEMVTFVKKISDHFTEAARSKRIKLDIASEQKELIAWVDAEKLDVVIYNLLGNAIKFTPEGKAIRIIIKALSEEQSFSIAVYDQGPGVPQEKLEEIFELFHEGEQSAGRELKGTGIGLALSKEFVNLHGGMIWAENNGDGGLTVTVKLKLGSEHYQQNEISFVDVPKTAPIHETPIEQQLVPQPTNTSLPKDKQTPMVLLVEDNDELRLFIKGQLSEFYRVETARDGEEGLQKAFSLLPDLIVSDIMMPKMDGIQMMDRIKNDVNTSHIPVVLLSAKYSIESQIEGLKYGADYYITKPFNNEFLITSIDNLIRQRKKLFESLVNKNKSVELSPSPIVITSKDEAFLKEVIQTVEDKMADTDFNIESLAETMHMNQNTFYKKFKSLTGLTLVEFVRDMRLQRAKQFLDAGGNNISEVAYMVGFSNPKYFSTCFKEKYRISPSDYVKAKAM
ncbi:MAG: response regulator, partial [Flavisolibacter sp.]|nr:response regulator [Flavisolibacter sp.]